jgi:hypothetical protein
MLRSLGIPARTPMGGMYVPLYGGSFGQHMWTEVYLGEAIGWLPVDCTANENTFIDAGHIRLKVGVTFFRPKSIEVLAYEPKVAGAGAVTLLRRTDELPFKVGEEVAFAFRLGETLLGEEKFTYQGPEGRGHLFTGSLDLSQAGLSEKTKTVVGQDGRLIAFSFEQKAQAETAKLEILADKGSISVTAESGGSETRRSVKTDEDAFVLHNNCILHLEILTSRMPPLAKGETRKVRMFHDTQLTTLTVTLTGGGPEEIEVPQASGKKVTAQAIDLSLAGLTIALFVDKDGRLLRYHQKRGDLTIERIRP